MSNILVVDDEQDLCEILQFNLENEGYTVATANSAEEALELLHKNKYDLMLLDVMLGGMSGYQLVHKLRTVDNDPIPVIFLTARNTENDMLTGFSLGGDDYIAKPFSIKEVLARVKAVCNRIAAQKISAVQEVLKCDDLSLDLRSKTVYISNQRIDLTKKEYLILCMLLQTKGRSFTREQILSEVWNDESYVLERTVDVHIARLRKKLGTLGDKIVSRPGFGYCFEN